MIKKDNMKYITLKARVLTKNAYEVQKNCDDNSQKLCDILTFINKKTR